MKSKYGYDKWPDTYTDPYIDMVLAKHWREYKPLNINMLDPRDHLLRALRRLFTPAEFGISTWTEEHAEDWCHSDFTITWGSGASGKSNDIGAIALLDWLTDPTRTITIMVSTTMDMLKQRNYGAVLRYFYILQRNPYFYIPARLTPGKQSMSIMYDSADPNDHSGETTCLRGVAVKEGSSERARENLQGTHTAHVRLIVDEMDLVPATVMDARFNLRLGAEKDFKFSGVANPESFNHLSAQYAEPDHPDGWMSVDENSTFWVSKYGRVRHHNGFHSPAIKEPEKYPYLINQAQIDKNLSEERGNADSKRIWTMVRGFPMRAGADPTVLTSLDLQMFGACNPPVSDDRVETTPIRFAGLDAAYSEGGDGCVFQSGIIIPVKGLNLWAVGLLDPVYLELKASSKTSIIYQIADQTANLLRLLNIPPGLLAVDDSGTQSLADVLTEQLRAPVLRAQFGGSPTDRPMNAANKTPAKDRYANFGTELWCLPAEYIRARQLLGLGQMAAKQYTTRLLKTKKDVKIVEPKLEFKNRTKQRSPDEADAVGLCCWVARDVLGFIPGGQWTGGGQVRWQSLAGTWPAMTMGGVPFRMAPPQQNVLETKYVDDVVPTGYDSYDSRGGVL